VLHSAQLLGCQRGTAYQLRFYPSCGFFWYASLLHELPLKLECTGTAFLIRLAEHL
jgi:hypothetical protein